MADAIMTDATMEEHQPVLYTIFCVIVDENIPFSVEIRSDATVDKLKDAIKAKKQPDLDRYAANNLKLFKVEISTVAKGTIQEKVAMIESPEEMDPTFDLRDYYNTAPPKKTIHVLVQSPPGSPSPLKHTPILPHEDFDSKIDAFLDECRPRMRKLLQNANHVPSFFPSWKPRYPANGDFAEHISKLRIPTVSGGRPSLLLHNLGKESSKLDTDRTARIPNIFSWVNHTYVTQQLVNILHPITSSL